MTSQHDRLVNLLAWQLGFVRSRLRAQDEKEELDWMDWEDCIAKEASETLSPEYFDEYCEIVGSDREEVPDRIQAYFDSLRETIRSRRDKAEDRTRNYRVH
jgi:hypothetical protein